MPRFLCPKCNYSSRRLTSILWHIQRDHRFESIVLKCGISGCPKEYRNVGSFKKHLQRHHPTMLPSLAQDNSSQEEAVTEYDQEGPSNLTPLKDDDRQHQPGTNKYKRSAALFLLKAREVKRLPQDTLDTIVEDGKDLFSMVLHDHSGMTRNLLERGGVDISAIPGLATHLENPQNPFQGLETEYLQTKYFRNNLGLLVSSYIGFKRYISITLQLWTE